MKKLTKEELREAFNDPTKVVMLSFGGREPFYPVLYKDGFDDLLDNYDYEKFSWEIRELLPYAHKEEFLVEQKKHGPYLRFVNVPDVVEIPYAVTNEGVRTKYMFSSTTSYSRMTVLCRWQDNSFCGKLGKVIE